MSTSRIASSAADFSAPPVWTTMADFWQRLGQVPLERVRMTPAPGTADERDVLDALDHHDRICELVDGVLVEKPMGYMESLLAMAIGELLRRFVRTHKLGVVLGPDATLRILPNQIRAPDVCFIAWNRFPDGKLPRTPVPAVAPDLAVEILSETNTEGEMRRKLQDYFATGTRLVWYIDQRQRTAVSYISVEQYREFDESGVLSGGDVLPGFELPLRELFAEIDGQ